MEFENQYLTYNEYQDLGGTLSEAPFNILEAEAQFNIDNYTYGRLKKLDTQVKEVKLCIYSLISKLKTYAEANARDKSISSENTDGYSISYAGVTTELTKVQNNEVRSTIDNYLGECKLSDGTPYLYMGV